MPRQHRMFSVFAALALGLCIIAPVAAQDQGKAPPSSKKSVAAFKSGNVKITVWQWTPPGAGKHPGLVLLHGIDGLEGINEEIYDKICQRVADYGYVVHFIHYMDRTNEKNQNAKLLAQIIRTALVGPDNVPVDDKARSMYMAWMGAIKDGVVNLRRQDNVNGEKIGLIGFSLGGFLAISVAAHEPDLKLGAVVELFGGIPKELHGKLKAPMPPILVMHSKTDEVVPFKECESLKSLLNDRKIPFEEKIFAKAPHMFLLPDGGFDWINASFAEGTAMTFLKKHLKGAVQKEGGQ